MVMLSIVVSIYNVENYLEKCLDSVCNQTFKDFECILVNDGSLDSSEEICKKFVEKDKRFSLINKVNGGLSSARNTGMEKAIGKYIYFLDSDDYLYDTAMEKCVNKLESDQSEMVIFDVMQHNLKNNTSQIIKNNFDERKTYNIKENKELLIGILNAAWNKMYLRDLFLKNNISYPYGYYYEDLGTTYRLLVNCDKISFINEPLYNYLSDRPGNITQQFNNNVYHVLDMVKINVDYFKEKGIYEKYYEELKFLGGINILECLKKTRNVNEWDMVEKYIDVCFYVIDNMWPEFPKCKYNILREKNNWIYANKFFLKTYLKLRKLIKR